MAPESIAIAIIVLIIHIIHDVTMYGIQINEFRLGYNEADIKGDSIFGMILLEQICDSLLHLFLLLPQ